MRCPMCGDKRSYLSENAARSALGYSIQGNFMARKKFAPDYAIKVYRCPFNPKRWHFGHNMATVAVIEAARQRAEAK
jgi:hypothetical protein